MDLFVLVVQLNTRKKNHISGVEENNLLKVHLSISKGTQNSPKFSTITYNMLLTLLC